ncbi:hypothetical protein O6H91_Y271600 [Diphasiastrum complanatum]|nr:hypothetical protein O6H91_Y271600 [Diphasiastrum complanatum]KAJ7294236.1 hypothetical protein O6H91_Y271600 [Diphasiastrum complanatum]
MRHLLSAIAKRVLRRASSAASTPPTLNNTLFSNIFINNKSSRGRSSILKRSELWIAYGSVQVLSQLHWKDHVSQESYFSSGASPDAGNKEEGKAGIISAEKAAADRDDVEPGTEAASADKGVGELDKCDAHLVRENEQLMDAVEECSTLLEEKDKSLTELKDRLLRCYAEVENVMERARRDAENLQKFAIQDFAKSLLLVADDLRRAAAAVPENFHNSESLDLSEAKKLLLSLLEGVKMTEKELLQVFQKYGVVKFEPSGQSFNPNFHLAVCEVQDPEKEPGTVAVVFKPGYMLHDRVIRPAEVAVVKDDKQ